MWGYSAGRWAREVAVEPKKVTESANSHFPWGVSMMSISVSLAGAGARDGLAGDRAQFAPLVLILGALCRYLAAYADGISASRTWASFWPYCNHCPYSIAHTVCLMLSERASISAGPQVA